MYLNFDENTRSWFNNKYFVKSEKKICKSLGVTWLYAIKNLNGLGGDIAYEGRRIYNHAT